MVNKGRTLKTEEQAVCPMLTQKSLKEFKRSNQHQQLNNSLGTYVRISCSQTLIFFSLLLSTVIFVKLRSSPVSGDFLNQMSQLLTTHLLTKKKTLHICWRKNGNPHRVWKPARNRNFPQQPADLSQTLFVFVLFCFFFVFLTSFFLRNTKSPKEENTYPYQHPLPNVTKNAKTNTERNWLKAKTSAHVSQNCVPQANKETASLDVLRIGLNLGFRSGVKEREKKEKATSFFTCAERPSISCSCRMISSFVSRIAILRQVPTSKRQKNVICADFIFCCCSLLCPKLPTKVLQLAEIVFIFGIGRKPRGCKIQLPQLNAHASWSAT